MHGLDSAAAPSEGRRDAQSSSSLEGLGEQLVGRPVIDAMRDAMGVGGLPLEGLGEQLVGRPVIDAMRDAMGVGGLPLEGLGEQLVGRPVADAFRDAMATMRSPVAQSLLHAQMGAIRPELFHSQLEALQLEVDEPFDVERVEETLTSLLLTKPDRTASRAVEAGGETRVLLAVAAAFLAIIPD